MSCVRETSLEPPSYHVHQNAEHRNGESRKGRFLRGLRRMFRRRTPSAARSTDKSPDTSKSRSTSELLAADTRRKESAYGSGLSVSHDSIFTGERSGDDSAEEPSSRQLRNTPLRAELAAAVLRRGRPDEDASDDEEDLGLPRSPPASPSTDKPDKLQNAGISASSCSDGSLLSVGSSEMEEDSSSGHHVAHPRHELTHTDAYSCEEPPTGVAPLSHSAARHKMAVKPRRKHGAPRRNKINQKAAAVLPITPELNEESLRSVTPDHSNVVGYKETSIYVTKHLSDENTQAKEQDAKAKSSSLPPGLALSQMVITPTKLTLVKKDDPARSSIKRSKSSSQDKPNKVDNAHISDPHFLDECDYDKKSDIDSKTPLKENFFSRLLLRRSGKKKKEASEFDSRQSTLEKPQYKTLDRDYLGEIYMQTSHHITVEHNMKAAGQPMFANSARIDGKNVCLKNNMTRAHVSKSSHINHGHNNMKVNGEDDQAYKYNMKLQTKGEKEFYNDYEKRYEQSAKSFIAKEVTEIMKQQKKSYVKEDLITPEIKPRRLPPQDFSFHGTMPKSIPYFSKNTNISSSASPPKSIFQEYTPHFSSGYNLNKEDKIKSPKRESFDKNVLKIPDDVKQASDTKLNQKELKIDEELEKKNSIGKSQSFRYSNDSTPPTNWHLDKQMPSLPAIVGFSNSALDNWELGYRRKPDAPYLNVANEHEKRLSARNFNIFTTPANENNFDSLQSTDGSYLDSLKTNTNDIEPIFIPTSTQTKIDNDISQIEAEIDNIISSNPKQNCILKSSSLDSVKGSQESGFDDRRKTISIDNNITHPLKSLNRDKLTKSENFITVTHLNNDKDIGKVTVKVSKSDERLQKNPNVPEFLQIQLNKVDAKPQVNVVLRANPVKKPTSLDIETNGFSYKDHEKIDSPEARTLEGKPPLIVNKIGSQNGINKLADDGKMNGQNGVKSSPIKKPIIGSPCLSIKEKIRSKSTSNDDNCNERNMERKPLPSFGSKTSLQSTDSIESKSPDRFDEPVVMRKKSGDKKKSKDDEPELLKVFARRSLKIKDTEELHEINSLAGDILDNKANEVPVLDESGKKPEINDAVEDSMIRVQDRVAELTKCDAKKYKKDVANSTPEKRSRNRTFPDPSEAERKIPIRNFSFISSEVKEQPKVKEEPKVKEQPKVEKITPKVMNENEVKDACVVKEEVNERNNPERAGDDEEFRGILHVREQWERRAQQAKAK